MAYKRMKEVTKHLLVHPLLEVIRKDLSTLSPTELENKYAEVTLRNYLLCEILMTSGGKRPGTITNIKIGEFIKSKLADNNKWIIRVKEHKEFVPIL